MLSFLNAHLRCVWKREEEEDRLNFDWIGPLFIKSKRKRGGGHYQVIVPSLISFPFNLDVRKREGAYRW